MLKSCTNLRHHASNERQLTWAQFSLKVDLCGFLAGGPFHTLPKANKIHS